MHPGIIGDRGINSIDWALKQKQSYWGVTLIEAQWVLDHGDIWSSIEFKVPKNVTKGELYASLISDAAEKAILQALDGF